MWLATISLVALIPGIPPLLLVLTVSAIVTALGLALNILIERPALKLARRLDLSRPDRPGKIAAGLAAVPVEVGTR